MPYKPDYANDNFAREYYELYRNLGQVSERPLMSISPEEFKDNTCFYVFNLTGDFSNNGIENGMLNPVSPGNIRLQFEFAQSLVNGTTESLNVLIYSLYDSWMYLDIHREASLSY